MLQFEQSIQKEDAELNHWVDRIKTASSPEEIFAILDEFRPLNWTDRQRSEIARVYMRRIEVLGTNVNIIA
jgi:hypothetical protein